MVKIVLSLIMALCVNLGADSLNNKLTKVDKEVLQFNSYVLKRDKNVALEKQTIVKKENISKGWTAYTLDLQLKVKGKLFKTPYFLFTDGKNITTSMMNLKTHKWYGEELIRKARQEQRKEEQLNKLKKQEQKKELLKSYENKKHLIYGSLNSKNSLVIFSDPMCVFCIKRNPDILRKVKDRKDIAVYYYDFPLSMHPTAKVAVVAMKMAEENGIRDVALKVYEADLEKYMDVYKNKDAKKTLNAINKILGTSFSIKEVLSKKRLYKEIQEDYKSGIKLGVRGTPDIYFNGSNEQSELRLERFINKDNERIKRAKN